MKVIITAITSSFRKRPFISNVFAYGSMYITAELGQQYIIRQAEQSGEKFDWLAVKRFGFLGTFLFAPALYGWYHLLDKTLPSTASKVVIKKVLLDQGLCAPIQLAVFYVVMSILEEKQDIFFELKCKWLHTYQLSCTYWLPVQYINFFFVPAHMRVAYVGVASFIWINVLCYIKRMKLEEKMKKV
ncbi:mpv17-like protein [Tachypleus tridentatus]|uniref:mpv17-like protein n=1 Tax=Tachypleus tridentatus TaxID=6853 RepID=UPI003FD27BAC